MYLRVVPRTMSLNLYTKGASNQVLAPTIGSLDIAIEFPYRDVTPLIVSMRDIGLPGGATHLKD